MTSVLPVDSPGKTEGVLVAENLKGPEKHDLKCSNPLAVPSSADASAQRPPLPLIPSRILPTLARLLEACQMLSIGAAVYSLEDEWSDKYVSIFAYAAVDPLQLSTDVFTVFLVVSGITLAAVVSTLFFTNKLDSSLQRGNACCTILAKLSRAIVTVLYLPLTFLSLLIVSSHTNFSCVHTCSFDAPRYAGLFVVAVLSLALVTLGFPFALAWTTHSTAAAEHAESQEWRESPPENGTTSCLADKCIALLLQEPSRMLRSALLVCAMTLLPRESISQVVCTDVAVAFGALVQSSYCPTEDVVGFTVLAGTDMFLLGMLGTLHAYSMSSLSPAVPRWRLGLLVVYGALILAVIVAELVQRVRRYILLHRPVTAPVKENFVSPPLRRNGLRQNHLWSPRRSRNCRAQSAA